MKNRFLLPILIFTLLVSACSSPPEVVDLQAEEERAAVPSSPSTPEEPQESSWSLAPSSEPIDLDVNLEAGRTAEAMVTLEGGTLSATGGDGTLYTLEIPADALIEEVVVKMTPVAQISGMPFGMGSTYAVQLEPEGLIFYNFAILSIVPALELPVQEQITFGYEEQGKGLFLALPVVDSAEIKIQILHFSGYGVTKGLLSDIEPVRQRLGGSEETRLQSLVSEMLSNERQRQILGDGEADEHGWEDFDKLSQGYYQNVIEPRLAAAGESCAAGKLAIETLISYERQRQLLGVGETEGPGEIGALLESLMEKAGQVCLKEEYKMCRDDHIIHRMIPVWLGVERQAQLLGAATLEQESKLGALARGYVEQCLRFELEFESTGLWVLDNIKKESHVKASIPLHMSELLVISGQAPLVNEFYDAYVSGCRTAPQTGDGTFETFELVYEVGFKGKEDELGYIKDLFLLYYPGLTAESYTLTCGEDSLQIPPGPIWTFIYQVTHGDERSLPEDSGSTSAEGMPGNLSPVFASPVPGNSYIAAEWKILGGELFAEREWQRVAEIHDAITEKGSFKLFHRPGQ